jgi:pimeloyl-ACP methyl ester carboxylesterase
MRDLNSLIPYDSGIVLTQATGINNSGEIAAVGYRFGDNPYIQRGYLLKVSTEKLPLIFIPGIAGSDLYELNSNGDPANNIWAGGLSDLSGSTLMRLSLEPPSDNHRPIVAVDAIRQVTPLYKIYGPLLDCLEQEEGYIPYDIQGNPKKRNTQCTGAERYNGEKPTLFVFAYDWRLSNAESAQKLKEYVDCVQRFYPGKQVNFLTHSMGGLVARRYVLDYPSHNINKFIATVPPFLGAPKAIDALLTGRWLS